MSEPYLIGIAGPSCSGKSEVARRLARILRAPTLVLDHYYRDLVSVPFEERIRTNFDAPESLDRELIVEHVRALKNGQAIEQPTYDFAQHIRASKTESVPSAPFVLVEGLFGLYWPELRDALNLRIYIDAAHDVCLARRIFRDVRERGRTESSVRAQYEATVQPMCECHIAPTQAHADLVLSGVAPVKQSVYTILIYVAGHLGDPSLSKLAPSVED
jgi:uridine kinase